MIIFIALLVVPFALITLCFAVEVFAGLAPLGDTPLPSSVADASAVIIVPAHDEALTLRSRLERLVESAVGKVRILVVADNCSDHTAGIARELGVEVIERNEPNKRGKGFALDFARRHLSFCPPDIVVVIDADCAIDPDSLSRLILTCAVTGQTCQATNLQKAGPDASPIVQLSTFAFYLKNVIRQRGLARLAGRVHLLGTGMAIPWPIFIDAELATSNIVEDLKLGQELADSGRPAIFVEGATVWSNAETDANTISQRRRWEGGFLQNAISSGPRMFSNAVSKGSPRLVWAAINAVIPPLALLILCDVAMLVVAVCLTWATSARSWPILLLCGSLVVAGIALVLAWRRGGRQFVTIGGLARAPLYMIWKLPIYAGFVRGGAPKEWVRTGRG